MRGGSWRLALWAACFLTLAHPPRGDAATPAPRQGLAVAQMSTVESPELEARREMSPGERKNALAAALAEVEAATANLRGLAIVGDPSDAVGRECVGAHGYSEQLSMLRKVCVLARARAEVVGEVAALTPIHAPRRIPAGGSNLHRGAHFFAHRA